MMIPKFSAELSLGQSVQKNLANFTFKYNYTQSIVPAFDYLMCRRGCVIEYHGCSGSSCVGDYMECLDMCAKAIAKKP